MSAEALLSLYIAFIDVTSAAIAACHAPVPAPSAAYIWRHRICSSRHTFEDTECIRRCGHRSMVWSNGGWCGAIYHMRGMHTSDKTHWCDNPFHRSCMVVKIKEGNRKKKRKTWARIMYQCQGTEHSLAWFVRFSRGLHSHPTDEGSRACRHL